MTGSRVVTLLFTDLVSSTEHSHRLGDDAADHLRRTHFRLLREAIAACRGEEVKNLGDGLMVVFESPSDALACAVAMQQSIDHHNRRQPEHLGLRVGLHTGEVTKEDDDYFGTAVVLAERLCKVAGPGQIVASDVLRLIVGSRGGHTLRDLGPLELKGVPDPIGAVDVAWEPLAAESIALPRALTMVELNPFVGRDEERQKLFDAFKLARAGERQLVFIVGEPGMGKSRLCSEFAQVAHGAGATVLYGRCDEESLAPYQPFVEALRHYVSLCPAEELRAQATPFADDLARLVPDLLRRLPGIAVPPAGADADTDRLRLFDAVNSLLVEAAGERALVLVLDDLHWADRPTLQLLRHLLRTEPFPLLVVATYRETDLARTHPLATVLADLRREHPFERLHLKGLDTDEIVLALERGAGHSIGHRGRRLAETLSRTTDGNPFFILQIMGHLTDTGRIYEQDGVWTFDVQVEDLGIPEGVKEVIGRRISALSEEANRALGIASVLGRDFELEILERVADTSADELVDALDAAVSAGIVLETQGSPGCYSFAHALVRETLYGELTATRRVRLHRKVASVFEELSGGDPDRFVSELAHHLLEAAQVAEVDKAIEYAGRAAARAVSLLAYEEGVRLYERALSALELRETPDEPTRVDLLIGLGDAQWKAGETTASRQTFHLAVEGARTLGDVERLAAAALGLSGPPESTFPSTPGLEVLEELLEELPIEDSITRARVMARVATILFINQREAERRAKLAQEAVEMSRRIGDLRTISFTLRSATLSLWDATDTDSELAFTEEVIRLAEDAGDKEVMAYGHGWRSVMLLWAGDAAESDIALETMSQLTAELKQPFLIWSQIMWAACRLAMRGELEEAERLSNEAYELGQQVLGEPALPVYGVQLIAIRWQQGRLAEVEPILRMQAEAYPDLVSWRCSLAYALAELDRLDEARAEFDAIAEAGFPIPRDATWPVGMARLALACALVRDVARAEVLYDLFKAYSGKNVVVGPGISSAGSSDRYLGLLAATLQRWDVAEQHFGAAVDLNERMGARPFVAFTLYDYASMLMGRAEPGDGERARALLDQALPIARDVGMPVLEQRITTAQEKTQTPAS